MPFTLSHVAAVLPLIGRGDGGVWVASGLVAGSMAPDVPFFADSLLPGVYRYGAITHRWWAVPTVDAGIAAGMVAAWHGLLREPLAGLLPLPAEEPLPRGAAGAGTFVLSAAVGAASHVLWDSFTHPGRAGVRAFPVLERPVAAGLPLCTVLQYGTSLLGLAVLRARGRRAELPSAPQPHPTAAVGLVAAAAVGAVHRLARRQRSLVPEFCFGAGAGLAVGATVYAVLAADRGRVPSVGTAPGAVPQRVGRCVRPSAAGRRRAGRAPR